MGAYLYAICGLLAQTLLGTADITSRLIPRGFACLRSVRPGGMVQSPDLGLIFSTQVRAAPALKRSHPRFDGVIDDLQAEEITVGACRVNAS